MSEDRKEPSLFAIVPAKVRYDQNLSLRARLLFGELNAMAYSNGYCYATDAYFASLYNVNRTTISADINDLKKCGYIEIEIGTNAHGTERRIYVMMQAATGDLSADRGVVGKNRQPPNKGGSRKNQTTGSPENTTTGSPENPTTGSSVNQTTGSRKNQTQKNINNKNNITPISPEFLLMLRDYAKDDGRLLKALLDLAELRTKLRKPYKTARQITLLFSELEKLSGGSTAKKYAMLDKAIEMGWLTVYPLRDSDSPGSGIVHREESEEWKPTRR